MNKKLTVPVQPISFNGKDYVPSFPYEAILYLEKVFKINVLSVGFRPSPSIMLALFRAGLMIEIPRIVELTDKDLLKSFTFRDMVKVTQDSLMPAINEAFPEQEDEDNGDETAEADPVSEHS